MSIGGFGAQGAEERGIKRPQEEFSKAQPQAKKARIDSSGALDALHRIAMLGNMEVQNHPELVSTIQSLAKNLGAIPQNNLQGFKHDITLIKKGLQGNSDEKKAVINEIDTVMECVKKGKKMASRKRGSR